MNDLAHLIRDAQRDGLSEPEIDHYLAQLVEFRVTTDAWEIDFPDTLVDMPIPGSWSAAIDHTHDYWPCVIYADKES